MYVLGGHKWLLLQYGNRIRGIILSYHLFDILKMREGRNRLHLKLDEGDNLNLSFSLLLFYVSRSSTMKRTYPKIRQLIRYRKIRTPQKIKAHNTKCNYSIGWRKVEFNKGLNENKCYTLGCKDYIENLMGFSNWFSAR